MRERCIPALFPHPRNLKVQGQPAGLHNFSIDSHYNTLHVHSALTGGPALAADSGDCDQRMMNSEVTGVANRWTRVLLAGAVIFALSGCGRREEAAEVVVKASSFAFEPKQIEARVGQPVTLVVQNTDGVLHDFVVDAIPVRDVHEEGGDAHAGGHQDGQPAGLHLAVAAGKAGRISFTPQAPGTYTFYCSVSGHREAGMTGTLVVKE